MSDANRSYRQLIVWNKAIEFAVETYRATEAFPMDERFGLTAQLRRASVSVPSNMAEGNQRDSLPDYARFCRIAMGSTGEIDTQLELSKRLGYLSEEAHQHLDGDLDEIRRMLRGLILNLEMSTGGTRRAREEETSYGTNAAQQPESRDPKL